MYDLDPTYYRDTHGQYIVSDIVDGYRVQRVYQGYTQAEAIAAFVAEVQAHRQQA